MARSKAQLKANLCDTTRTSTGKPCGWPRPCPYHNANGSKKRFKGKRVKQNRSVIRQEKLIQARLAGKSVVEAGREAGYAESTLKGKIFQIEDSPEVQARIQAHIERAKLKTNEIIGTIVSFMRTDLADHLPDDELLQRSKRLGISHQIKKIRRTPVIVGYDKNGVPIIKNAVEMEAYNALEAAKLLTKVFALEHVPEPNHEGQRNLEASVERIMQRSRDLGVTMPDEELRQKILDKLAPAFRTNMN